MTEGRANVQYVRRAIRDDGKDWDPALLDYARAVQVMQERSPEDPSSWEALTSALAVVNGDYTSSRRDGTWFFLPANRVQLLWFEDVMRFAVIETGGPEDWTLPYWDAFARSSVPAAFLDEGSPDGKPNVLFRAGRSTIDVKRTDLGGILEQAMSARWFTHEAAPGFGGAPGGQGTDPGLIEAASNLVHVEIGGDMNNVTRSPSDPLFWVHRANIDRLWEAWNRLGNANPADAEWLEHTFELGVQDPPVRQVQCGELLDIEEQLGYTYDDLPDRSGRVEPVIMIGSSPEQGTTSSAGASPAKPAVWIVAVNDPSGPTPGPELAFTGVAARTVREVSPGDLVLIADDFRRVGDGPADQWTVLGEGTVDRTDDASLVLTDPQFWTVVPRDWVEAAVPDLDVFRTATKLTPVTDDQWARLRSVLENAGWHDVVARYPSLVPDRRLFRIDRLVHLSHVVREGGAIMIEADLTYMGNVLFKAPYLRLDGVATVVKMQTTKTGLSMSSEFEVASEYIDLQGAFSTGDSGSFVFPFEVDLPAGAEYEIEWSLREQDYGREIMTGDLFTTRLEVEALDEPDGMAADSPEQVPAPEPPSTVDDGAGLPSDFPPPGTDGDSQSGEPDLGNVVNLGEDVGLADFEQRPPLTKASVVIEGLGDQETPDVRPDRGSPQVQTREPATPPESGEADHAAAATAPPAQNMVIVERIREIEREYAPPDTALVVNINLETVQVRYGEESFSSRTKLPASLPSARTETETYGAILFNAIFNDERVGASGERSTLDAYDEARSKSGHHELRIELKIRSEKLRRPQWEYLRDPRLGTELAVEENSPLLRRVGSKVGARPTKTPLNVVVAICSPEGLPDSLDQLDIAHWRETAELAVQPLVEAGLATLTVAATDDPEGLDIVRLNKLIIDHDANVLHLVCHGGVGDGGDGKNVYQLAIDDPAEPGKWYVNAGDLKLGGETELVVLAACNGFDAASEGEGAALANKLIDQRVPAVISMQRSVQIDTARLFTQRFYHDLIRSGRVDMALARTRRYLHADQHGRKADWGVPVLHLGNSDGQILDIETKEAAKVPEFRAEQVSSGSSRSDTESLEAVAEHVLRDIDPHSPVAVARAATQLAQAAAKVDVLAEGQDLRAIEAEVTQPVQIDPVALWEYVKAEAFEIDRRITNQVAASLNIGKHVVLIGVPGTGKTTIAQTICRFAADRQMSADPVFSTASADWTTFDTVGGYVPSANQSLAFSEGVFLKAIATAGWLALDEVNRADIDKAIGELFTVMAGQSVDLPFMIGDDHARILAPAGRGLVGWVPQTAKSAHHYVVHPNWRIVATMNVFDKASLFSMSSAFMRRLAFVDCGVPPPELYGPLLERWNETKGAAASAAARSQIGGLLARLFDEASWVMTRRPIGPAIAEDMIDFLYAQVGAGVEAIEALAEAMLLFLLPQFDGLSRTHALQIHQGVADFFAPSDDADEATQSALAHAVELVQSRLRDLYPHLADEVAATDARDARDV